MKRDIVYPYKKTNSDEFKYSLKSLKNLDHGKIYVIGDKEEWFDEYGITHVRPERVTWGIHSPYHDVFNKLITAVMIPELSDEFILMNDDFFVMKPAEIENWHRGDIREQRETRNVRDTYTRALDHTIEFLGRWKLNYVNYELHVPFLFDKKLLADLLEECKTEVYHRQGLLLRTLYGNRYQIQSTFMTDVKNTKDLDSTFLSSSEVTFKHGEIGKYIREHL